ncbi:hypothetical protein DL96DRAFT_1818724 [Flagelloscypha sp. PMI_526]|nr:hypothetical protein DL96DRAFT_1818724 [Flagelloscypha sp. PMI_526]
MAPIKSHNKSRTGCRTCKKRKVKCDESSFPRCRNCTYRGVGCDWPENLAPLSDSSFASLDEPTPSTSRPNTVQCSHRLDTNNNDQVLSVSISSNTHNLDMASMELLHHWITDTCQWLLDGDQSLDGPCLHLEALQVTLPKLAVAYPSLMHAILSLASMHIHSLGHIYDARFGVSQDYYALALYHQKRSQDQTLAPCPEKTCPGDDNCSNTATANFMAHVLLSILDFCTSSLDMGFDSNTQLKQMIAWMENQRQHFTTAFFPHRSQLKAGPLGSMLNTTSIFTACQDIPAHPSAFVQPITFPSSLHSITSVYVEENDLHGIGSAEVYKDAVRGLEHTFKIFAYNAPFRAIFTFPAVLPSKFLLLLHEWRQRALVILAHFCGLFQESQVLTQNKLGWWWGSGRIDFVLLIRAMLTEKWQLYLDQTMVEARANGGQLDVPVFEALYTQGLEAVA